MLCCPHPQLPAQAEHPQLPPMLPHCFPSLLGGCAAAGFPAPERATKCWGWVRCQQRRRCWRSYCHTCALHAAAILSRSPFAPLCAEAALFSASWQVNDMSPGLHHSQPLGGCQLQDVRLPQSCEWSDTLHVHRTPLPSNEELLQLTDICIFSCCCFCVDSHKSAKRCT